MPNMGLIITCKWENDSSHTVNTLCHMDFSVVPSVCADTFQNKIQKHKSVYKKSLGLNI